MDLGNIYSKTGKGTRALSAKSRDLPKGALKVLPHIDGKTNGHDLLAKLDKFNETDLRILLTQLESGGYIRTLQEGNWEAEPPQSPGASAIIVEEVSPEDFFRVAEEQPHHGLPDLQPAEPGADHEAMQEAQRVYQEFAERMARETQQQSEAEMRARADAAKRLEAERIAAEEKRRAAEQAKQEAAAAAAREAEQQARAEEARQAELARLLFETEQQAAQEKAAREAKLAEEARQRVEAEARAAEERRIALEARQKAREEEAARKLAEAERKAREAAEKKAKKEEEARLKAEAKEQARQEKIAREEAERQARAEAAQRAQAEEEARRAAEAERQHQEALQRQEAARQQAEADARARAERQAAEAAAREEAERLAQRQREAERAAEVARKVQEEAERQARLAADEQRKHAEAEARQAAEEEALRNAEARARARLEEKQQARDAQIARKIAAARQRQRLSEFGNKVFKSLRTTLLILPLLLAAAAAALHFINLAPVAGSVMQAASEITGEPVRFEQLHAALFPRPQLRLEGVRVGKDADIQFATVTADLAFSSLLDDRREVQRLEIEEGTLTPADLGRIQAWFVSAHRSGKAGLEHLTFRNITIAVPDLRLPSLHGSIALLPAGTLRQVLINSAENNLSLELTPEQGAWKVSLDAHGWQPPGSTSLKFDELRAEGMLEGKTLRLDTVEGSIYAGRFKGDSRIAWEAQPRLTGRFTLENLRAEQAMTALMGSASLEGALSGDMTVTSMTENPQELVSAAVINARFALSDGRILGLDLASSMLPANSDRSTRFETFKGTVQSDANVARFRQLVLESPQLHATGQVDILNREVDGKTTAELLIPSRRMQASFGLSGTVGDVRIR